MLIRKGFRYRLYPTDEQAQFLARQFGCCRFVYNHFLAARKEYYEAHKDDLDKKGLTYADTSRMLTALKQQPDTIWLQEVNAQVLQQALKDLDTAYTNFFAKRATYPKFKRRNNRQSFRVPQHFRLEGDRIWFPKATPIKIVLHRPFEGTPKQITVSRTPSGKYYASILCEIDLPDPDPAAKADQPEIGVDVGVKDFAVISSGEKIPAPNYLRKAEKRLCRLQRQMCRRQKGSRGREKARRLLARQHEKVANQRRDFQHQLSYRLTRENQAVYVEDLEVQGLLHNHHLAKSISDAGWGEFLRQLAYKGTWTGCRVQAIGRFLPSSKRCHACGYVLEELPLKVRAWTCPNCGVSHDRDINAARNILQIGQQAFREQQRTAGAAGTHTPVEKEATRSLKPETEEETDQ